jgi:putative N6-adenine-specific DNA methylase
LIQTSDNNTTFRLIAKTTSGLENVLAAELANIGATNIEVLQRAIAFDADKRLMYKANYTIRTALRIIKPISTFIARTEDQLYDKVNQIHWQNYLTEDQTLAIDAVVSGKFFTHSHYIALKTKDAIVDQFRDRFGKRPSVDINDPHLRINIHISNDQCTVLLDSSGTSLHKRGYRTIVDKAPINEVLAAGLIQLTGWQGNSHFVDCMCGSATIPIEAAMFAMKIPPGYFRKEFGFMKWSDFDKDLWQEVVTQANQEICDFDFEIIGSDRSLKAVEIARENIRKAHLHKDIKLLRKPMDQLLPPQGGGVVIINPPYGERLEESDLVALYKNIGDAFKKNFKGYKAWVISSDIPVLKLVGLKPSRKLTVFNGPLECRFVCFDIFGGSMKDKKSKESEKT